MRTGVVFPLRAFFGLALAIGWLSVLAPGDDGPQRWVTTWTTANAASDAKEETTFMQFATVATKIVTS